MAKRACWREIPTELSLERFKEFILPHLTVGRRGPAPKLSLHALFNYILAGCEFQTPQKCLRLIKVYAINFIP